jgi:hypothetical protein
MLANGVQIEITNFFYEKNIQVDHNNFNFLILIFSISY